MAVGQTVCLSHYMQDLSATKGSGKKRKSSTENAAPPSKRSKRVSFGPQLSPERFDKTLPVHTPLRKGASPSGRRSVGGVPTQSGTPRRSAIKRRMSVPSRAMAIQEADENVSPKGRGKSPAKSPVSKSASPKTPKTPTPSKGGVQRSLLSRRHRSHLLKETPKAATPKSSPKVATPKSPKVATPKASPKGTSPKASRKSATPKASPKAATPKTSPKVATPKTSPKVATPKTSPKVATPKTSPKVATPKASLRQQVARNLQRCQLQVKKLRQLALEGILQREH
ncbi:putative nascent polypeptide-associated complex subunit alpha, muscle-specific form isoform X7 [Apostichopus japonicus]|uniref:Putative nascent polypeptide-associated complex subunit alpha, muscle-specific form isoform X7 n=1 Tax=Stichopus japonicus TaxID=307972 RepID=A0A2G8KFY4_STIJA|nr:putative nascent polypeptide-associated complex subunit alpha, muscle-specific form isoform X7 [Apostichopus japonicus]